MSVLDQYAPIETIFQNTISGFPTGSTYTATDVLQAAIGDSGDWQGSLVDVVYQDYLRRYGCPKKARKVAGQTVGKLIARASSKLATRCSVGGYVRKITYSRK